MQIQTCPLHTSPVALQEEALVLPPSSVSLSRSNSAALQLQAWLTSSALTPTAFQVPATTKSTRVAAANARARSAATKRPRVEYTENTFYTELGTPDYDPQAIKKARKEAKKAAADKAANDSDDDQKKGGRGGFVDKYVPPPPPRTFPVYKPKSSSAVMTKGFTIPGIKRKGVILETKLTHQALGVRRPGEIIPRPLHDPLQDHAIVLWDPTVDDREAERELERERLEKEAREKDDDGKLAADDEAEKERRKVHRSLAEMLGIKTGDKDKNKVVKVPVVIDPRVGKVLRPHQVEGVKFLYRCVTGMTDEQAYGRVIGALCLFASR
jgi:DNA repair and recombination protein RAD54 and RAD54-like protein